MIRGLPTSPQPLCAAVNKLRMLGSDVRGQSATSRQNPGSGTAYLRFCFASRKVAAELIMELIIMDWGLRWALVASS
jgi:hypothetical protein